MGSAATIESKRVTNDEQIKMREKEDISFRQKDVTCVRETESGTEAGPTMDIITSG